MSDLAQAMPWGWDEGAVVTGLRSGSDDAFDLLVLYHHAPVYNLVRGMTSSDADAADITQEVFLKAFRAIHGFRGASSLKTWLYRIAVREVLNHRRWCWRHHRGQFSLEDASATMPLTERLEDGEASPFDETAMREQREIVRSALEKVPVVFRSAVILRDLEGLSYEEAAEVLSVSVGTVKSRILRGRRALREILDPILHSRWTSSASPAGAARVGIKDLHKEHSRERLETAEETGGGL